MPLPAPNIVCQLQSTITVFGQDRRGTTTVIFSLGLLTFLLMVGLVIDSSRAYDVASRVQSGLDAAALAGAKLVPDETQSDSDIQTRTRAYFATFAGSLNVAGLVIGTPEVVTNRGEASVEVSVDVVVPTLFGQLGKIRPNFSFSPSSKAVYNMRKSEISLVLDTAGTMCNSPIAYSGCTSGTKLDAMKDAANRLLDQIAAANPEPGQVKTSLVPHSASVNLGQYQRDAILPLIGWLLTDNCVIDRDGAQAHSNSPPGAAAYFGTLLDILSTLLNVHYSCSSNEMSPLADVSGGQAFGDMKNRIAALKASGKSAGHLGIAWGWYAVSEKWQTFWPADSKPREKSPGLVKAVVVMTDGDYTVAFKNGGQNYTPGSENSKNADLPGTSKGQFLKFCDALGEDGVALFIIGFSPTPKNENTLRKCAAKAEGSYHNADELNVALNEIIGATSSGSGLALAR